MARKIITKTPSQDFDLSFLPWSSLVAWFVASRRELPWRLNPDPYWVWVSEVMSQQTTLAVVVPYFERFVSALPSVQALAQAGDAELRPLWQGLGYYSRLRNLQAGARYICSERGGEFPRDAVGWQKVPGCGPYTSAAIASVCFGDPVPVVDGNVIRVLARLLLLGAEVHTESGRSLLREMLGTVIGGHTPGDFNQALMELGALVCRPKSPRCGECPLRSGCRAFRDGSTDSYPVPKPRRAFVEVPLVAVAFVSSSTQEVALVFRREGFLSRTQGFLLLDAAKGKELESRFPFEEHPHRVRHVVTHHRLSVSVVEVSVAGGQDRRRIEKWLLDEAIATEVAWHPRAHLREAVSSALDRKVWRLLE